MSKSLGNLITPEQLIQGPTSSSSSQSQSQSAKAKAKKPTIPKTLLEKAWPVDVLRLWVASSDFTYDVSLGVQQMLKVQETYQKIRNTHRYLLSNLYDFKETEGLKIAYDQLSLPDKWCLGRLWSVSQQILKNYDQYKFTNV